MVTLRTLVFIAAALGSISAHAAEPAPQFPYSAFVAANEAAVRAGPGETYYPVLNLKVGDAVEVWRQDPGGWLAVRPPEGSFTWISADFIQQTGEKTGRIVGNEVNARIGTKFSDLRDAIQVQLSAGDEVDILESRTLRTGDQETLWYKILPPAGEFRWIAAKHVVLHPSQLPPPAAPNLATRAGGDLEGDGGVRQASFDVSAAAATTNASVDLLAGLRELSAEAPVDEQLDEMEAILSRMVTAEPTAWSFAELKTRGETLLDRSESTLERSRARTYLAKIARFEDIQKRYSQIAQVREQTSTVDRALVRTEATTTLAGGEQAGGERADATTLRQVAAEAAARAETRQRRDVSRFDGVGRLMIVANAKPGRPGYALADETGEIAAFVVAAPGMNLQQYVGLDVGVTGNRGFVSSQRIEEIAAKRIEVIGSRR
jgi:uncharacterized protein YraI